jgi:hypothetical protein
VVVVALPAHTEQTACLRSRPEMNLITQAAFDINLFLAGPIAILYWILKDLD